MKVLMMLVLMSCGVLSVACSNNPTAATPLLSMSLAPRNVLMPTNSSYCFTVAGGTGQYRWDIKWTDSTGVTGFGIGPSSESRQCIGSGGLPGVFEITVTSGSSLTAYATVR